MSQRRATGLRKLLGLRPEYSYSFYLTDILFRKIFRQNAGVKWRVHHTSTLHSTQFLKVGKETFPGDSPGFWLDAVNGIEIGDYTNIGPNVSIISANHDPVHNDRLLPAAPIKIGKGCWLAANCVILPGVTLGDFTVVGAGAIVTKSFPEGYCVLAGNPAVVLRRLDAAECAANFKQKEAQ